MRPMKQESRATTQSTKRRVRPWTAFLLFVALLASACSSDDVTTNVAQEDETIAEFGFWSPFAVAGDEVEGFASLAEMSQSADLVVTAQVSDISLGRSIQYDTPEDVVNYASVSLDVIDTVEGASPDALSVEFLMTAVTTEDAERSVESLKQLLPAEPAIFFLRAKRGEGEQGLFRLVNRNGLLIENNGALVSPLEAVLHGAIHESGDEHSHEGIEPGETHDHEHSPVDGHGTEAANFSSIEELAETLQR